MHYAPTQAGTHTHKAHMYAHMYIYIHIHTQTCTHTPTQTHTILTVTLLSTLSNQYNISFNQSTPIRDIWAGALFNTSLLDVTLIVPESLSTDVSSIVLCLVINPLLDDVKM